MGSRRNPILREFYQRLLAAGKLKKVALTACMQKLLTVLNSMMRTGEHWDPTINMSQHSCFMRDALALLIKPATTVYEDLKPDVFGFEADSQAAENGVHPWTLTRLRN